MWRNVLRNRVTAVACDAVGVLADGVVDPFEKLGVGEVLGDVGRDRLHGEDTAREHVDGGLEDAADPELAVVLPRAGGAVEAAVDVPVLEVVARADREGAATRVVVRQVIQRVVELVVLARRLRGVRVTMVLDLFAACGLEALRKARALPALVPVRAAVHEARVRLEGGGVAADVLADPLVVPSRGLHTEVAGVAKHCGGATRLQLAEPEPDGVVVRAPALEPALSPQLGGRPARAELLETRFAGEDVGQKKQGPVARHAVAAVFVQQRLGMVAERLEELRVSLELADQPDGVVHPVVGGELAGPVQHDDGPLEAGPAGVAAALAAHVTNSRGSQGANRRTWLINPDTSHMISERVFVP